MGFSLWNLIKATILVLNAAAVLNEKFCLSKCEYAECVGHPTRVMRLLTVSVHELCLRQMAWTSPTTRRSVLHVHH